MCKKYRPILGLGSRTWILDISLLNAWSQAPTPEVGEKTPIC